MKLYLRRKQIELEGDLFVEVALWVLKRSEHDNNFDNSSDVDEDITLLDYLAIALKKYPLFYCKPPSRSTQFRRLVANFMKVYHHRLQKLHHCHCACSGHPAITVPSLMESSSSNIGISLLYEWDADPRAGDT